MMSVSGWFNRAAHSLPLVRYSPAHPFPRIAAAAYPAPFSGAHFPVPPLIFSPRRRHLFPRVACPIVVICPRIVSSSPSLVPLVISSGRGAGRGDIIRIVSSARRGQASRRAGVAMRPAFSSHGGRSVGVVIRAMIWQASRQRRRCRPCRPCRPCWLGPHRRASRSIGADERGVVIHVVV